MASSHEALDLQDLFATFTTYNRTTHALVLLAGFVVYIGVALVVDVFTGSLGTVIIASVVTGAYFGILYTRALGGPLWDILFAGFVAAISHDIEPIRPPEPLSETAEIISVFFVMGIAFSVVWAWHRHLGPNERDWTVRHYPAPYPQFFENNDHEQ